MKSFMKQPYLAIALVTSSVAGQAWAGETPQWERFRGDSSNSGRTSVRLRAASPTGQARAPFATKTRGLVWGTPVIDAEGITYVGSADKNFYKISREGEILATYALTDRADSLIDSAAALFGNGMVVVPGGDGFLHSLDRDLKARWTYEALGASQAQHQSGVIVNSFEGNVTPGPDGWVYAGSDNGTMYALDAAGRMQWSFFTKMMIWSAPCFARDGSWMAFGSLDGNLYILEPKTGAVLATFKAGGEVKSSPTTNGVDRVYFGTSQNRFIALDLKGLKSGKVAKLWDYPTDGEIYSSPALSADGNLYFGSLGGTLHSVTSEGKPRWTYLAHAPISSSPAVSDDGVVVFGARNGKLYALDAATGTRLWSFRSSPSERKANLDSSPAIRADGVIVAGSYGGSITFTPAEFCPSTPSDPRCETGGREDIPAAAAALADDSGRVLLVDRDGIPGERITSRGFGTLEPIYLKLFGKLRGRLSDRAAISTLGLSVESEPKARLNARVSSDGSVLNLLPEEPLAPGTTYRLKIQGSFYENLGWIENWSKLLFGRHPFAGDVELRTAETRTSASLDGAVFEMGSLYMHQPAALDTYIPAALDGQAFIATAFDAGLGEGRFVISLVPAAKGAPGTWTAMVEPPKAFAMQGTRDGANLRARGKMVMSAMGATMNFKAVQFTGVLGESGSVESGDFFALASCLSLKGSGSSYSFPYRLISFVCDPQLQVKAAGLFEAFRVQPAPAAYALTVTGQDEAGLALAGAAPASGSDFDFIIGLIRYDSRTGSITGESHVAASAACAGGSPCRLSWPKGKGDRIQLLFNQHLISSASLKN